MPKTAQLVETPTLEFDQLALVNEVLAKRQEEAQDLRIQLSNLRHQIQSARIQWEEQRRQEEASLKLHRLQQEQEVAAKFNQADLLITARQEAFNQAENERQAAVKERLICQQERQQLGNLIQERVEVERFRLEVNRLHAESMQRFSDAQAALNTANQRHEQATARLAEVEQRTGILNALHAECETMKAELDVRFKHLNTVQEAIGHVIEKLPVPETPPITPLPASVETSPVMPIEPLPEMPPLSGLSGEVEIATQVMPGSATEAVFPSLPGQPSVPYVHPSQRRVMDGTQPLNDQ